MTSGERDFVRWLEKRCGGVRNNVVLGIGDDMAMLRSEGQPVLVTSDMLLDGVHFQSEKHSPGEIGRKAACCSLSDCAAMAVKPVGAILSLALPRTFSAGQAQELVESLIATCEEYGCPLIGGDTTSWDNPMAVDVSMLAQPHSDIVPVRRDGGQKDDGVFVTGKLGGSLLGKHLTFTPRVAEAEMIARTLGPKLHAMMDISDGVAIDLDRMIEASGVGALLEEKLLQTVASDAAKEASANDGRSILDHVLSDGEDFELLIAGNINADAANHLGLLPIGKVTADSGLRIRTLAENEEKLEPKGYQHL